MTAPQPTATLWHRVQTNVRPELYMLAGAWAALYMSADRFYAAIGTTPSAVGFDVREVLISAAAVMLAFTPIAWVAVAVSSAVFMKRQDDGAWPSRPTTGTVVSSLSLFSLLVWWLNGAVESTTFVAVMPVIGFGLVGTLALQSDIPLLDWGAVRFATSALPVVAALAAAAIWLSLWSHSVADAQDLRPGKEPSLTTAFLASHARVVCATPVGGAAINVPTTRSLLLLGADDGRLVLRDWKMKDTLVVPADKLVLRSVGASTRRCKSP